MILVNTARGALIDEGALIDALRSGRIRHAGLDVFHREPLKPDHPLAGMENVTLTAHAAFRTPEASMTLVRRAIDVVRAVADTQCLESLMDARKRWGNAANATRTAAARPW